MADEQTDAHSTEFRTGELLQNLSGAFVWESDAAAVQFSFVSDSAATVLGYPLEQWRAEDGFLKKHVHPEDWGRLLGTLYEAAAEGGVQACEHRMFRLDGSTLWAQTSVHRSSNSNGSLLITGLTVDITRIKEREHALRDAEAHHRLLVENLREYAVFMLSLVGKVASWNPSAQRLKGYNAEEAIGMPLSSFFPPEEVAKNTHKILLERAELERQAEYEGWLLRKDGTRFWANLTLSAVTDEQGRLRGFSNVARDLTQRKRTEEALRESEERFRLLVDNQEYGIFMVSPEGVVESWNRGAQRLEGYRAHEIVGLTMSEFFPEEAIASGIPESLRAKAARVGSTDYEGWLVRKGGERFWGLLTIGSVEDENGRLRGFSVDVRDITERKQKEQELRQSEEHFRLLVGSVQDYGVFMLSVDGIIESWNQGAQRLKGYRAHEVIGSPVSRFFPPEENEKHTPDNLVRSAVVDGSATYEGWLVRKGGARFWGIVTLSTVDDENGRLRGLSNVARDLTERKRAEDALRESEERLRLLIDNVLDYGVFMVSPSGRIASWSPGAERLAGYNTDEIMGGQLSSFFPPDELEKGTPDQLLQRAMAEGRAEHEGWMVRRGGTIFWASVILSAVMDSTGQLRGFSSVVRDLTERMRAERALSFLSDVGTVLAGSLDFRTTLDKVAHLATREVAQACIVEMLVDQTVQPVAIAHVEGGREHTLQMDLRSVPSEPKTDYGVAHVIKTGRPEMRADIADPGWVGEALGFLDPNTIRNLGAQSYLCVPLTARSKTFGAIILIAAPGRRYSRDDLLLAEEFARRAALAIDNARLYEQAQTAIRMREEILAVVSHDLRNPLTMIQMGASRLLAEASAGEPGGLTSRVADKIKLACARMNHMIRDLLDFSSIETGQLRIEVTYHDVDDLIEEVVEMWQPIADEQKVRLEVEAKPSHLKIRCDGERIVQVFSNLIGNAIKFTGEGGVITIRSRVEHDRVAFSVSDTGPGIPQEDLNRIFERYWKSSKAVRDGLGLGLAISKAIVESHGGTIWAESAVGRGTTLSFALPIDLR